MNIIMVCESALVSGGAEKVAIQEALELRRRGIRVGYIAANDSADPSLVEAGVEVLLLNTKSFYEETNRQEKMQKMFGNLKILDSVQTFLKSFDPRDTAVHVHTYRLKLSGIVPHAAQELGFMTLIHCHDYSAVCPTSLWYDFRVGENCSRKPLSLACITCECQNQAWKYKLPKLTSYFQNQKLWKINARSSGMIHITKLERETTEKAVGKRSSALSLPPISDFTSTKRVPVEQNKTFVFVGRLTREKGIYEFLECTAKAGVPAVVVGDGPLRVELETQYSHARFTGWLDQVGIDSALRSARALIVPSLWRETLGLSVLDAMNLGVPSIVSDQVGAQEFIEDGVNGLIVDLPKLGNAIDRCSDNGFVKGLSEAAFAAAQKNSFTVKKHVDQLVAIYERSLEESLP